MKFLNAKICVFSIMMVLCLFGCAEDFLFSDEAVNTFSTIDALTDKCTEETNGVMVFVKKEATMYVCTDNEWVAMQNKNHKCHSEDLVDGDGIAIVCDGETIGVVNNGKDADMDAIQEQIEDKGCHVVDTTRNYEEAVIKVTIQCGDAQTEMKIPFTEENKNLANVYKKHVVVRFPVRAEKTTNSLDVYEEIWKNLKGDNLTELTVMDLDEKLNATGKMFVTDLFADTVKKFVTVEETNTKTVEFKVVRLESDVEVTNLSTPIAQLRIKMNLSSDGITTTNVIYSAITDLSDESDYVVIDFLTDYKAERVKTLVKGGKAFADASVQANKELATALSLVKDPSKLAAFEHYLPGSEGVGLAEYFNSIAWVMALIDQSNKTPGFNTVYNAFRKVFAENGDFNKAIETTYAGKKQSMFFVDYLALLINAHFFKWNCALDADGNVRPMMLYNGECETDDYRGHDEIYYKILQDGFVSAYKLDTTKAVEFDKDSKIQKSEVEGGHFRYFEYYRINRIWYPASNLDQIAFAETGKCDATAANAEIRAVFTVDNADYSMLCQCERGMCGYGMVDPCQGRDEGYEGFAYFGPNTDLSAYVCKKVCYDDDGHLTDGQSGTCNVVSYVPSSPSLEDIVPNGKTIDEILNPAEGEGPLGKCTAANKDVVKSFDEKDAERSTTTGYGDYICNGAKWVKASPVDLYCVGDNVKPTEQKVADEDLAALGLKYDQKCEFEDVLYVRNSEESGSEWIDATGYIREVYGEFSPRRSGVRTEARSVIGRSAGSGELLVVAAKTIRDSVYVFMNGYKENAIYKCIDGNCSELSDDNAITSTINKFRDENGKNSFTSTDSLSIFCNKAEYKKAASGYVAGIAYEVELGEGDDKTLYIASLSRNDWRKVTLEDIYGKCDEDKMKNQTELQQYNGKSFKCDYDKVVYAWIEAGELDTHPSLGICTYNRGNTPGSKVVEVYEEDYKYYLCNIVSITSSTSMSVWENSNDVAFVKDQLGECSTDGIDKNDIEKNIEYIIKSLTVQGDEHKYKCSIGEKVTVGEGTWVDASIDAELSLICNRHRIGKIVTSGDKTYVCAGAPCTGTEDDCSDYQPSTYLWQEVDEYCETNGENLIYGGYLDNTSSSSRMSHCSKSGSPECQTETGKKICHVGTESFVKLDSVWQSVAEYCKDNSTGSACEFPKHVGDIDEPSLKYYEQTEYYVNTEQGYKKAKTAEEYCDAFDLNHEKLCVFGFDVYSYSESSSEWILFREN